MGLAEDAAKKAGTTREARRLASALFSGTLPKN